MIVLIFLARFSGVMRWDKLLTRVKGHIEKWAITHLNHVDAVGRGSLENKIHGNHR